MGNSKEIIPQPLPEPEAAPTPLSWLEQFKAEHDINALPEQLREPFGELLEYRAANRAYYLSFPAARFKEGIGVGDSPHEVLVHHVGHARLRLIGLSSGTIEKFEYGEVSPTEHRKLDESSRGVLIQELDSATNLLYQLFVDPSSAPIINRPYGKMTKEQLLQRTITHEALHNGINVGFNDFFATARPQEMKNAWG